MRKIAFLFLIAPLLITSCQQETDSAGQLDTQVVFSSTIQKSAIWIEETSMHWSEGDKIGIFANGSRKQSNIPYITNGSGFFSSTNPVYFPKVSGTYDFIAYYPFSETLSNHSLEVDLTKSQHPILYSNNLKEVHADNMEYRNRLEFRHMLPRIYMQVTSPDNSEPLTDVEAHVKGRTKASLSVMEGKLSIDENSSGMISLSVEENKEMAIVRGVLLPASAGSTEVHLTLNNNNYQWVIPNTLHQNHVYVYNVVLLAGNDIRVSTSLTPLTSDGVYTLRPTNPGVLPPEIPDNPEPLLKVYMETPLRSSDGTSPNGYQVTHMITNSSWLNNSTITGEARNYTIHFDTKDMYPIWVAYPLHPAFMTSGNRTDDWQYDPLIPIQYQPNLSSGWQSNDLSRGHMLPSASRSASRNLNRTTFYYTNMVAQDSKQNSSTWNQLEEKVRYWSKQTERYDTLYVVTGSILPSPPEVVTYTRDVSGQKAAIPKHLYKALYRKDRITGRHYSIAFKIENNATGLDYIRSVVPVEQLEKETGFTFFPKLPEEIKEEVKKQTNLGDWS